MTSTHAEIRSGEEAAPIPPGAAAGVVGLLLGLAAALVGVRLGAWAAGLPILSWMLVVIAFGSVIVMRTSRSILHLRGTGIDLMFLTYVIVRFSVELINAADLRHPISPQVFVDVVVVYMALLAARASIDSSQDLSRFLRALALPVFFVAPLAVAQFLRIPGIGELIIQFTSAEGFARRFNLGYEIRGTSTLGHHTQLGGYLVALAAVIGLDILTRRRRGESIRFSLLAMMVTLLAQVTTLTFATIGATALVILVTLFAMGIRPLPVVGLGLMAGIAWSAFGASIESRIENQSVVKDSEFSWLPETLAYRAGIWTRETIPAIAERPLTGWGFDVYAAAEKGWPLRPQSIDWLSPESEYMRVLMTGGFISLFFQALLILAAFGVLISAGRLFGSKVVAPVVAALVAILLISVIHNHLSSYGAPLVLWPLIGAVAAMSDYFLKQESEKSLVPGKRPVPIG